MCATCPARQGQCLVFDDSFEHEVSHNGQEARVVLMFNFWHPDISETDKERSMEQLLEQSAQSNLARSMHGG